MREAKLLNDSVHIPDSDAAEDVHSELYYGKMREGVLELSLPEAMHLVDRQEIEVSKNGEKLSREKTFETFCSQDGDFDQKYTVYDDLRDRGFIVKTGFKFGTHFRTYPRGVNPYKEGPKTNQEHTQRLVHAVHESREWSMEEISRLVRLAENVRADFVFGVVDSEHDVTYYEIDRLTP
nr:MAG: tRNA intron endonuclease [Candidatus Nanosalinarum sp. J07AB56]